MCLALAVLFNAVFVVPPLMIFGNRTPPFEFVHNYARSPYLQPGQTGVNVFTVKDNQKECQSEFDRYFTDASGSRFFLGTFRGGYKRGLQITEGRRFEREWTVPIDAEPGPGLYEAHTRFWCNWFQEAYPIAVGPVKIPVTIVPRGTTILPQTRPAPMPSFPQGN